MTHAALALELCLAACLLAVAAGVCAPGTYGPLCNSTCVLAAPSLAAASDAYVTVAYPPAAADYASDPVANPDRGLYRYSSTKASSYQYLDAAVLAGWRAEGYTLLYRIHLLDSFVDADIRCACVAGR